MNIWQRNFVNMHPEFRNAAPEPEDEPEKDTEEAEHVEAGTKKRKRVGRIPKGQDFWSLVDEFFKKEITVNKRGNNCHELPPSRH